MTSNSPNERIDAAQPRLAVAPPATSISALSEPFEVPHRGVPAWLLSLLLHTAVLIAMLLLMSRIPNGGSEVANRAGGIVLVDRESTTTEYLSEGDVELSASESAAPAASEAAAPKLDLAPDLPGMTPSPIDGQAAAESALMALPGAADLAMVPANTGTIGGQVTTEVFGIQGTGSRFVYVFDRSQSMDGYGSRPMLAARQELTKSLDSLTGTNQFQIIFYNDQITIFRPDSMPTMYFADDDLKAKAKRFVQTIQPSGGTDHLNALKQAFRLSPDVIFLLTDAEGGFNSAELQEIVKYNRSAAIINTIEFGERRGRDRSLEEVARSSGGQYLFKNIRTLRIDQ